MADTGTATPPVIPTPDPNAPVRPEWCPEKFWVEGKVNTEALAKSYGELERKQGTAPEAEPVKDTTPPATGMTPEQAEAAAAKAGLDLKALAEEYSTNNGKLTDETLKALAEKGISTDVVKTYATAAQAQARELTKGVVEVAGGEAQLKQVYEWAQATLPPSEIEAYNAVVQTGNMDAIKLAFMGVMSRYNSANPEEPELLSGSGRTTDEPVFTSKAQITAAMRDPRYQTDEAYRQQVARRMAKTTLVSARRV